MDWDHDLPMRTNLDFLRAGHSNIVYNTSWFLLSRWSISSITSSLHVQKMSKIGRKCSSLYLSLSTISTSIAIHKWFICEKQIWNGAFLRYTYFLDSNRLASTHRSTMRPGCPVRLGTALKIRISKGSYFKAISKQQRFHVKKKQNRRSISRASRQLARALKAIDAFWLFWGLLGKHKLLCALTTDGSYLTFCISHMCKTTVCCTAAGPSCPCLHWNLLALLPDL